MDLSTCNNAANLDTQTNGWSWLNLVVLLRNRVVLSHNPFKYKLSIKLLACRYSIKLLACQYIDIVVIEVANQQNTVRLFLQDC